MTASWKLQNPRLQPCASSSCWWQFQIRSSSCGAIKREMRRERMKAAKAVLVIVIDSILQSSGRTVQKIQTRQRHMWFKQVFGFHEPRHYKDVRSYFRVEESDTKEITLVTVPPDATVEIRSFYVGKFETPSVSELRQRIQIQSTEEDVPHGLTFQHVVGDVGVLHRDPANQGAVFQAASQFNCLEMTSQYVSPEAGITNYMYDRTQGPICALACPAATLYRNYFVNGEGQGGEGKQIDLLQDTGVILGNEKGKYWRMQNGYAMPTSRTSIQELANRMESSAVNVSSARDRLRVGVHWSTEVTEESDFGSELDASKSVLSGTHNVTQVYCSALPIGYHSTPSKIWKPFAKLVLDGLYEATLGVAAVISSQQGGERVRVFLTQVGGGVFQNDGEWIVQAIQRAINLYQDHPVDVFLVHYGDIPQFYQQELPEILNSQCVVDE